MRDEENGAALKTSALMGHSGLVGSKLAEQTKFDKFYNSTNIESIAGQSFELLVVSAMPAAMWVANKDPDGDRAILDRILECLYRVSAKRVILMSTVSVYADPVNVDEDTPIDPSSLSPYGKHRWILEQELAARFPNLLIVRLASPFGRGLKKSAIYDFLCGVDLQRLHYRSAFQFYCLDRLWIDISIASSLGIQVINLVTEPISVQELAKAAFDLDFFHDPGTPPVRYDVRTRHNALSGGAGGYLCNQSQVLNEIATFIRQERSSGRVKCHPAS